MRCSLSFKRSFPVRVLFTRKFATLLLATSLGCGIASSVQAQSIDQQIDAIEDALADARLYVGNYPNTNNDPNPVRRAFLGLDQYDDSDGSEVYAYTLSDILQDALDLQQQTMGVEQRERLARLINETTEFAIQGWGLSGNISLMEGLRISYPNASAGQSRPVSNPLPKNSTASNFQYVSIKDATIARLHYDEGIRVAMEVIARNPGDSTGKAFRDIDTQAVPPALVALNLPGAKVPYEQFPQYAFWLDESPQPPDKDRVMPLQTSGYQMGNLLQKQGQATQSIGYRLWSAAYFGSQAQRSPDTRKQLLDAAVKEIHAGANSQFLASIALASVVGDTAEPPAGQSAWDIDKLYLTRTNIAGARGTIEQIRRGEKPTLPIDEIMAGDAQVSNLINTIDDVGKGAGSFQRAEASYNAARDALFTVQRNATEAFQEEQTRQKGYLVRLAELTGIPIPGSPNINTPGGQSNYRQLVATQVNTLLGSNPDPTYGSFSSQLGKGIQQVVYLRQEVLNAKAALDSYPQRIKVIEDTLGANASAIDQAEGRVTGAQIAIGVANSIKVTYSASVNFSSSPPFSTFSGGVTTIYDPGAIKIARLQNDITRAGNIKELKFIQNAAAAEIRNLLIDQDLAYGQLKSQIILLDNAVADVNNILGDTDRLLGQLRDFNEQVAELAYNDPIWNTELTAQEEVANRDLDAVVQNLYKLGKLLEIRWIEPYANPVTVLVGNGYGDPQALDADYSNFWNLESVFALGSVDVRSGSVKEPWKQAQDFLGALEAWDTKLRTLRTFEGDLAPIEISLRQDVFGYPDVKTVDGVVTQLVLNDTVPADTAINLSNIRRFQNLLLSNGLTAEGAADEKARGFLIKFSLGYHDNLFTNSGLGAARMFGQINAWNYRLEAFKVRVKPMRNKSVFDRPTTEIILAQSGTVSNIDYLERSLSTRLNDQRRLRSFNLDNYIRYNANDLNFSSGSPFLVFSISKDTGTYPADVEVPAAVSNAADSSKWLVKRYWSPFCSKWQLEFVPHPSDFEIENIDDILIQLKLTSGQPSDPFP